MIKPRESSAMRHVLLACWLLGCVVPALAQRRSPQLLMLGEVKHDVSLPLWQMSEARGGIGILGPKVPFTVFAMPPRWSEEYYGAGQDQHEFDQQEAGPLTATIGLSFEGIAAINDPGQVPPDTNGAVGATQFVQWVNVLFAVYDKTTGHQVQAPRPGKTLWSGFGGPCETNNSGQPLAQYDKAAARWVMAQPVLVRPFTYCVAVSTTSDATGTYNRYAFPFPADDYPGYGKLAVWPDAYYASFNIYQNGPTGQFVGPMVVAFDRANMLTGSKARPPIAFQLTPADFSLLPSDFDGTVPPATSEPNFFLELGSDQDSLSLFKFYVDFTSSETSGNSAFKGPIRIPTARYLGCTRRPSTWKSIEEPLPGAPLAPLGDRLMYRLAWHNVGGVEHLVANHSVMPSSGSAGAAVRWYDITSPNGTPVVAQQGTFSSPSTSFWMGSIAMDKQGDIALGFSASSRTLDPSIEYTGRLSSDPPDQMEPARFIKKGTGVQLNTGLWGAYSSMSIDPADDCTFWYTTEYIRTTGSGNWNTRIASLRFQSCP